jgi:uncharacterized peroxidase-related enzyme
MAIENPYETGPRVSAKEPETVREIIEEAPEAAKQNMQRAEAILGALEDNEVPDKYSTQEEWGFTFTGVLAHHPETFKIWWAEEGQVFAGGELSRGFKELIGAVIAHERGASICIAWHTTSAQLEDLDPKRFTIAQDFEEQKDELPDDERLAIEFALASVERPDDITADDVEALREAGYSDADIVELVTTAGTAAKFANFAIALDI